MAAQGPPASMTASALMITPCEALRILEAKEREMAVGGRGVPSARQAAARHCAKPPVLDHACVARARDRDREVATPFHNSRLGDIADEPGSPVDGAGAARDDDGAAASATRAAAAGSRQSSPQAPAAFFRDGSAGEAHRDNLNASSAEYYHASDNSNDVQVSELQAAPDRRHGDCLAEVGDKILVERRLLWALQMPLAERRARRNSKPHSCVGSVG
jgi:hypothetical protein